VLQDQEEIMKAFFTSIVFGIASLMVIPSVDALADATAGPGKNPCLDAELAKQEKALLEMKKNGKTMWGSERWMKTPEYYASLPTPELATECFARPTFGFEMTIFDENRFGFQRLRIMHDGFAELFDREDMWKGILAAYDHMSSKIDPGNDLRTIVSTSNNFNAMGALYQWPAFKKQVEGREAIFLAANLRSVKRYRWYLDTYDPEKLGTDTPFFREPCSVARVALVLAERVDPKRYARIAPAIQSVRWPKEQDIEDVKKYLDLVIKSLCGLAPDEYRLPAFGAVEKMRGFSMQNRPGFRKPDRDSILRDEIMAEFRRIGKEVVPAIACALKDPDVQMRRNATLVLIELAGDWTGKPTVDTRTAIPSLISATEDPDHHVRAWAAHALSEIGPDAKEAVPVLTNMLKDSEEGPRNMSAMALGQIGAAARTALPALREALKDPKEDVRRISKAAIALIEKACVHDDQATE
jgi:hypothetical protein